MNKLLHAREIATTVSHVPPHAQTFIQTELSLRPISVCRRSCSNTLIGLKWLAIFPPHDAIVSFQLSLADSCKESLCVCSQLKSTSNKSIGDIGPLPVPA